MKCKLFVLEPKVEPKVELLTGTSSFGLERRKHLANKFLTPTTQSNPMMDLKIN